MRQGVGGCEGVGRRWVGVRVVWDEWCRIEGLGWTEGVGVGDGRWIREDRGYGMDGGGRGGRRKVDTRVLGSGVGVGWRAVSDGVGVRWRAVSDVCGVCKAGGAHGTK